MARAKSEPIDHYLQELWDRGASDLHLTAGAPPLLRIDGVIRPIENLAPLKPPEIETLIFEMLTHDMGVRFQEEKEIDFSFNWRSLARFRANAYVQRGSMGLAVRAIPLAIPSFTDLGLPGISERLTQLPHGLILVTGPTGCGKSTTLASMLDHINQGRACHILTIEDPIEYVHRHGLSFVNQREVGEDTQSFARALRSALSEDPDVLLIGRSEERRVGKECRSRW